jgi:hypothetical protein
MGDYPRLAEPGAERSYHSPGSLHGVGKGPCRSSPPRAPQVATSRCVYTLSDSPKVGSNLVAHTRLYATVSDLAGLARAELEPPSPCSGCSGCLGQHTSSRNLMRTFVVCDVFVVLHPLHPLFPLVRP